MRRNAIVRAAPRQDGGSVLTDEALAPLGWTGEQVQTVLRALGFAPTTRPKADQPLAWRRRRPIQAEAKPAPRHEASPFAALANLKPPPAPAAPVRKPRPRRRHRGPRRSAGAPS